jgi:hypothetical protein
MPPRPARELAGHDGPVLAVRYNGAGTYCLTCGKVRERERGGEREREREKGRDG